MRQAVLVEPKHIEFREVEAPKASDLKEHQVLLNIKRIGICGSEIHSYHGCHPATFYPVVQGHEYSAVVVATGTAVTICKATLSPHVRNLRVGSASLVSGESIIFVKS